MSFKNVSLCGRENKPKKAEIEMRKKLDKVAEVKRLSNIIRGIQTEISKKEEQLSELKRYRMFIDQLTPAKYRKSKKKPEQARSVTSETSSGQGSKIKVIHETTQIHHYFWNPI